MDPCWGRPENPRGEAVEHQGKLPLAGPRHHLVNATVRDRHGLEAWVDLHSTRLMLLEEALHFGNRRLGFAEARVVEGGQPVGVGRALGLDEAVGGHAGTGEDHRRRHTRAVHGSEQIAGIATRLGRICRLTKVHVRVDDHGARQYNPGAVSVLRGPPNPGGPSPDRQNRLPQPVPQHAVQAPRQRHHPAIPEQDLLLGG